MSAQSPQGAARSSPGAPSSAAVLSAPADSPSADTPSSRTAPSSPNRYLPGAAEAPRRYLFPTTDPTRPSLKEEFEEATSVLRERRPEVVREYAVPRDEYRDWTLQGLPDGLVYKSYLAGVKEPRNASVFNYDSQQGWIWDIAIGARVGIVRFGTDDPVRPEGFQLDIEGAAMPRLDLEQERDLISVDFRAGVPLTYGIGPWSTKLAFYHISSHVGDEFLIRNPGFNRLNYSRDVLVFGQSYYVHHDVRVYGEVGYATYTDVAEPWEFQFGLDYSPLVESGVRGSPFFAVNTALRQEVGFGGDVVVQAGWQWRPTASGKLFRAGVQYFNGKSDQFSFYDENENKVGLGLWYDY